MGIYNINEVTKMLKRIFVTAVLLCIFSLNATISYAQTLSSEYGDFPYEQSFNSVTRPSEISIPATAGSTTNAATFTASGVRLTSATQGEFGAIFVNDRRFSSSNGINIEFEYIAYGGNGADGFTVFFFDESEQNPQIGSYGAAIGYSYNRSLLRHYPNDRRPGLTGAYLGIAFDSYGNFKTTRWLDEEIIGGIGIVAGERSHVTLRGAGGVAYPLTGMEAGYTGYPVLITQCTKVVSTDTVSYVILKEDGNYDFKASSTYAGNFDIRGGATFEDRDITDPAYRKVFIDIYPIDQQATGMYITVKIQHGETVTTVIDKYPYKSVTKYRETGIVSTGLNDNIYGVITGSEKISPPIVSDVIDLSSAIPDFLRIGFAAATGQGTDIHMIKNLRITLPGAAEAYDDFDTTGIDIPIVIDPFANDLAYQGVISENMIGSNTYINPASFKFRLTDGSDPGYTYNTTEGIWTYNPLTEKVTFSPASNFEGDATIEYSIKGGLPGHTNPFDDEAYRSLPATITITVRRSCPFSELTNGIVYVKDYGSVIGGIRDGRTWETAYDTLANVLKAAKDFPGCIQEIWVAKGTYYPKYPVSENTYEYYTYDLVDGVKIYGGFAGVETSLSERTDIHGANRTILSGDLNKDDNYTVINYNGSNENATYQGTTNNVYHVVLSRAGVTSTAVLDGFTIEGGNARNENTEGGGIQIADNSTPSLSNLVIRYNRATQMGGGIANLSTGAVTITNVEINNNIGGEYGAGFYSSGYSLTLRHFDIHDNLSNLSNETTGPTMIGGGGIASGELHLLNGKITGNNGTHIGGGLVVAGNYTITNVTIADNSSVGIGGGLIAFRTSSQGTINNTILWGNTAITSNPNIGYFDSADPVATQISYSLIQGSGGSLGWNTAFGNNQGNNIDLNPLFNGVGKYPYQITTGSPAINAGNNALYTQAGGNISTDLDLARMPRLIETVIDMGAYEFGQALYTVQGTVFPFVHIADDDFDGLFKITAGLYPLPTTADPFTEINTSAPLYTDSLVLYDKSVYIPGTPKNPGAIGNTNNPGIPVTWSMVGKEVGAIDNTEVEVGGEPNSPVGLYTFEDVQAGEYLLVISRPGYITRYAKISVTDNGTLGHRELLAGDINEDRTVSVTDLSLLNANFAIYGTDSSYKALYDLDGNGYVDSRDVEIILALLRTSFLMYTDTYDWLINY